MQISMMMKKIAVCGLSLMFVTSNMGAAQALSTNLPATDFTGVAKAAIPGVVSIRIKEKAKAAGGWYSNDGEDEDDEGDLGTQFWKKFFGFDFHKDAPAEPREGQGSGFIVSADGFIITNGHVVRNTSEIMVQLHDSREFPAKVIGQDNNTDIALIKIDAGELPFLKLGNSDAIEVGQWVAAIGTPMGLEASLTSGVVSAKGRNNLSLSNVEDYIQTDAALYHGNSGGPLLNLNAEVIGINTAIASKMGGYLGIGFAIPSNIAQNVMDQLLSKGSVSRGYIGVLLQEVNADLAAVFGLNKVEGALIAQVSKDSPAEKAGIKQGDVIISYNKLPVNNVASLRTAIALMSPGSQLDLSIMRNNQPMKLSVNVGEYPVKAEVEEPAPVEQHSNKLGLSVGNVTPEIAAKFNLGEEKGVLITKVDSDSLAQRAGLRKGAIILAFNQKSIESVETFQKLIKEADPAKPYLFLIKEGKGVRFVSFKSG